MSPEISDFARRRMHQRNISDPEVVRVLETAYSKQRDADGNHVYEAVVGARRIEVIYARDSNPPFVITVRDLRSLE